jgi:hypothetical protein
MPILKPAPPPVLPKTEGLLGISGFMSPFCFPGEHVIQPVVLEERLVIW